MNDVDRYHGLHTQECFDYARKTMADSGNAHCIVQCADARSARLAVVEEANRSLKMVDTDAIRSWLCEIAHSDGMPAKPEEREAARVLIAMFDWKVCAMCDLPANGSIAFGLVDVCSAECGETYVASK